jgi:beta-N-acetylhexosaminidase
MKPNITTLERHHALTRLAAKVMQIEVFGESLEPETRAFLEETGIRSVCLFRRNLDQNNPAQLERLTQELRDCMGDFPLIAVDQEGGTVIRVLHIPIAPSAMSLGAIRPLEVGIQQARAVGAATARGLRSLGINWNFAPVVDVNTNPLNPVIGQRSFGSDPLRVAELAAAWLEGSQSEGVACCIKHFPGHGDTHSDSHYELPVVDKPLEALEASEFLPFWLLKDQAPAIMTAHIRYPQLDNQYPATLSKIILTDLLRNKWGYHGVIITDSLFMSAIANHYPRQQSGVLSLQAGADMVMALGTLEQQKETLAGIVAALERGELEVAALERSAARLDALAQRFPSQAGTYSLEQRRTDQATMDLAWQQGITAIGTVTLPPLGSRVQLVVQARAQTEGVTNAGIQPEELAAVLGVLYDLELVIFSDPDSLEWKNRPSDGPFVILASTVRGLFPQHLAQHWKPDLHLALWNPFQALRLKAPALLCYGYHPAALEGLVRVLRGEVQVTGVFPVQVG